jgi:hypothetical protein
MKRLIIATLCSAMAATILHAQTSSIKADIPFEFRAGSKILPAGQYVIEDKSSWLVVREVGGARNTVMLLSRTTVDSETAKPNPNPHLTFHRYGSTFFLSQIWGGFPGTGRQLSKTSAEKEIALDVRPENTSLVAKR